MGRYILSRELINTKNYFNLNHHAGTLTNWYECKPEGSTISLSDNKNRPHVRELKTALDSGLHTMDSGFSVQILDNLVPEVGYWIQDLCQWNLDSGLFHSLVGFRVPRAVFRNSKPRIWGSTSKNFRDCGFHKQTFFRIPLIT